MLKASIELDKFGKVANVIDSVSATVKSNSNINDLVKNANVLITGEFVLHMSRAVVEQPLKFGHMYEWGALGDPSARLWQHKLRGHGAMRQLTFNFKASQKSVPVAPILASIGVKRNHIFTMKASVMELGLPVSISPVLAKALVFEVKEVKRGASYTGFANVKDGIVFHKGTIRISKAGPQEAWGSFTREFNSWFRSGIPEELIKTKFKNGAEKTIKNSVISKLKSIAKLRTKNKTIVLEPVGIDKSFVTTLANSLKANYIGAAAQRRVLVQNDDI